MRSESVPETTRPHALPTARTTTARKASEPSECLPRSEATLTNVSPAEAPKKYIANSTQNWAVRSMSFHRNSGRAMRAAAPAAGGGCTRWPSGGFWTNTASAPTTSHVSTPRVIIVPGTPFSTTPSAVVDAKALSSQAESGASTTGARPKPATTTPAMRPVRCGGNHLMAAGVVAA